MMPSSFNQGYDWRSSTSPDGDDDSSLKELWSSWTNEANTIVRKEAELAKIEVKETVTAAAKVGTNLGVMAVLGFLALQAVTIAAGFGLASVLPTWFAFLIVGVVYVIGCAVLFFQTRKQFDKLRLPEHAVQSFKDDVKTAKTAFVRGMGR
jgi:hypothetical protein